MGVVYRSYYDCILADQNTESVFAAPKMSVYYVRVFQILFL